MAPRYGEAQRLFIKSTREEINIKQERYFHQKDWRNLTPYGGKYIGLNAPEQIDVDSFYIKPIAAWVPHLLIAGHMPSCLQCKKNTHVEVESSRWVSFPKLMFGIKHHRCLDTKMHPCRACKKEFAGHNKTSLEIDAKQLVGCFNFCLAAKHAVDDELCSFIVNSPDSSPARTAQHLQRIASDNCFNDCQHHLCAVRAFKIRETPTNVSKCDKRQPQIGAALREQTERQKETKEQLAISRVKNQLRSDIKRLQFKLLSVEASLDVSAEAPARNKLDFRVLREQKKARNSRDLPMPSLGEGKLGKLLSVGVKNAVDLLDFEDINRVFYSRRTRDSKLCKWKAEAQECFDAKRRRRHDLTEEIKAKTAELNQVENWIGIEESLAPIALEGGEGSDTEEAAAEAGAPAAAEPILFSEMTSTIGHSARFLSTAQVNSILETEFRHRKPMQEAKMMGLSGEIVKLDWSYKIAGKTYIYTGPGVCFRPYTSLLNVQNGDGMTVCWKAVSGGESLESVKPDLVLLKNRNERHGKKIKLAHVDVCCKHRSGLQDIFGEDLWVGLDSFHWMKRWDPALLKPTSEKGKIFRGAMSQALFVTTSSELTAAKERLIKKYKNKKPKDWVPTFRQMLKAANSTIPPPDILTRRVNACIRYFKFQDAETDMQIATWGEDNRTDMPLRFFKNSRETEAIIRSQLDHVRKGCLSDPPAVSLHHQNPRTGQFYCRRGTSSIESDHRGLDEMTGTHIGVGLCDRKCSTYFETLNEKKRVNRLGEKDYGTHRTETLALINSLASSAGFKDDNLPFPGLSVPTLPPKQVREQFGFNVAPGAVEIVSHPSITTDTAAAVENAEADDDVDPQEDPIDLAEFTEELELQVEADTEPPEEDNAEDTVSIAAERIVPNIRANETTMKAYERLTNQQAWYPFSDTPITKLDKEEFAQFDTMSEECHRNVTPRSRQGRQAFAAAWNVEVAERYKNYIEGDQSVILIRRKSVIQLQKHYDNLQQKKRLAQQSDSQRDEELRREWRQTLRTTRREVPDIPAMQPPAPTQYPTNGMVPFGMPMALNPTILQGAMQGLVAQEANTTIGRPFVVHQRPDIVSHALTGFRKLAWCITCGFRKNQHVVQTESFGSKCRRDCCAKCGWLKKNHRNGLMGPFCEVTARYDSPHLQWYDATMHQQAERQRLQSLQEERQSGII